jgi:AcrR family transcriptional regulator
MPRRVDAEERRQRIAAALMRVAAERGLEAVSLRHVAAEADVTSGMVQHYFPSKDAMMAFAMRAASARYEVRMTAALSALGDDPPPGRIVEAVLTALLPLDEAQQADARVALAFQSYATTRPPAAEDLAAGDTGLRAFLAEQLEKVAAAAPGRTDLDAGRAATALLAMTEGLGVEVLCAGLAAEDALAALRSQLALTFEAFARP